MGASLAQEHYLYDSAPRELTYDNSRIAIRDEQPAAGLAELGLRLKLTPWCMPGWWLADLPVDMREHSEVRGLVSDLSALESIDYATPVFVGTDGGPIFPTDQVLVGFSPELTLEAARKAIGAVQGLRILEAEWAGMPRAFRLRADSDSGLDVLQLANELAAAQGVLFSEPDMIFTGRGSHIPNDPGFPSCWGMHNTGQTGGTPGIDMNLPETWELTKGSPGVRVLVIDTGVQQDHPDLNLIPGADLTVDGPGSGGPVNVYDNHGTAVAGCLAAVMDNGIGTVGVAPESPVVSARTFITIDSSGGWASQSSWTVEALAFGESLGTLISNNSNTYGFQSGAIDAKYISSYMAGMVHFASAGNWGSGALGYPAFLSIVNAVAALDDEDARAAFSNWGSGLAFCAPGVDILTTDRTGGAGYGSGATIALSGTSYATPYVAGVAALILAAGPWVPPAELQHILATSCRDLGALGYDDNYGWGSVDAFAAVARCGFERYCTAGINSTGSGARLDPAGSNSLSANDLVLRISQGVPGQFGLLFYGPQRAEHAFGAGYLCVSGGFFRFNPPLQFDAGGQVTYAVDLTAAPAVAGPGRVTVGSRWSFQFWYRDPQGSGASGFNLSDALELSFCP